MTMESVKDKAKKAAGRARCNKCKFYLNDKRFCTPMIASVCYENFVKGYLKGYNEARKEESV